MKVAIVHDFLLQMGGAEKVVEVLHDMYPDAPVYTSLYDEGAMPSYYRDWDIRTSFMQRLVKQRTHRLALLLYPMAFESFDLSEYDVVISSSSAFAKGIITQPHTTHICYNHAPMRYAWTMENYVHKERVGRWARSLLVPGIHYLRMWDTLASIRVDRYVANSTAVAQRIRKFYGRDCDVIFPPVDLKRFEIGGEPEDYCVIVSRFVPYKRIDLAVDAFTRMNKRLKIIGTGRQMKDLMARAGSTVEFLGRIDDKEVARIMAGARAYIMPGEEDFGIAPVEANACGRPVVAYAAGGSLDSQIDGVTGIYFYKQTVEALCEAVERMEATTWDTVRIRANAERFATEVFRQRIAALVDEHSPERKAAASAQANLNLLGPDVASTGMNGHQKGANKPEPVSSRTATYEKPSISTPNGEDNGRDTDEDGADPLVTTRCYAQSQAG